MRHAITDSRLSGYLVILLLLLGWEIFSRTGWIHERFLPGPFTVLSSLFRLVLSLEIIDHVLISVKRILAGFFIGSALGYLLGFVCGLSKTVYSMLEMSIEFLRPIPSVILIPIAMLFLGIGDALNIGVAAWACSWPVFVNTMDGVRSVDQTLLDTARIFGLGEWAVIRKIHAASSLPKVFTGLRVGLGIAVAVGIITEMVASSSGVGSFILGASLSYRVPEMYAGIVTIGLLGYFLNRVFLLLEWRTLKWNQNLSVSFK